LLLRGIRVSTSGRIDNVVYRARISAALVLLLVATVFVGGSTAQAAVDGDLTVTFADLEDAGFPEDAYICLNLVEVTVVTTVDSWCSFLEPTATEHTFTVTPGQYYVNFLVTGGTQDYSIAYYPGVPTAWYAQAITVVGGATAIVNIGESALTAAPLPASEVAVPIVFTPPAIADVNWYMRFVDTSTGEDFHSEYLTGASDSVSLPPGEYAVALRGETDSKRYWSWRGNTADYDATPLFSVALGAATSLTLDASGYQFGRVTIEFPETDAHTCGSVHPANTPLPRNLPPELAVGYCENDFIQEVYAAPGDYVVGHQASSFVELDVAGMVYTGGSNSIVGASTISVIADTTVHAAYPETQVGALTLTGVEGSGAFYADVTGINEFYLHNPSAGEYKLAYGDVSARLYYGGGSRSIDAPFPWDSTPISIDSATESFDLSTIPFASMSGTVTREGGSVFEASDLPLEVIVFGYSPADDSYYQAGYADTDAAGNYSLDWLAPGTYKVGFREYSSIYASRWLGGLGSVPEAEATIESFYGGEDLASATPIVLAADDAALNVDGVISYGRYLTDIAGSAFIADILWMVDRGITTGYNDETFRPAANVSRQAMSAFLYRLAGSPEVTLPGSSPFTDVPESSQFYTEIVWMDQQGISTGYSDDTFRPTANVTRQAMAAFMYRMAGSPAVTLPGSSPFTDVPDTSQFYTEIVWMAQNGISTGYSDDTFRPGNNVTRQAMAAFMHRLEPLLAEE
jgi:hypothetical protein